MAQTTWEKIADELSERLRHHAYNCGEHGNDAADEHAHDCPYCADTAAWRRYLRHANRERR